MRLSRSPHCVSRHTAVCEPEELTTSTLFLPFVLSWEPAREAPCLGERFREVFLKEENMIRKVGWLVIYLLFIYLPGCRLRLKEFINHVCCFLLDTQFGDCGQVIIPCHIRSMAVSLTVIKTALLSPAGSRENTLFFFFFFNTGSVSSWRNPT